MTYLNCLMMLCALAGFSFLIYIFVLILDVCLISTKHKLILIKIGYLTIFAIPCIFLIMHAFSVKSFHFMLSESVANYMTPPISAISLGRVEVDWAKILFFMYGICCLILLGRIFTSYLSAKIKFANSKLTEIQGQQVFISPTINSPCSFGIPVARIYLPEDAEMRWASKEMAMILSHERNHLLHHDCMWKCFSLVIKSLLFFVPWSYALHQRFELEIEIYCDENTRSETNVTVTEYGELLLKLSPCQPKHSVFTNLTDSTLKRRFLAMKKTLNSNLILTTILSMLLMVSGAAISSTHLLMNNKSLFDITTKIFVDGKLVTCPRIITHLDQKAEITISNKDETKGIKMQLIPSEVVSSLNSIDINYDIDYKDGHFNFKTKQEIFAYLNQESRVRLSSFDGHIVEVSVMVKKSG